MPASSFVQTTLSTSYPRLLRLFQEFFSKIAVHTDTVYTLAQQSPETILTLRAIQPFEALYLARSRNRLGDAVQSAFSLSSAGGGGMSTPGGGGGHGAEATPTANEGLTLARAIVNELDAARFDPLLAKAVAKGSARAVDAFVSRAESLVSPWPSSFPPVSAGLTTELLSGFEQIARDHASTSLLGPLATPSQLHNADLTSALYHLGLPLERALGDHIESVRDLLRPSVEVRKRLLPGPEKSNKADHLGDGSRSALARPTSRSSTRSSSRSGANSRRSWRACTGRVMPPPRVTRTGARLKMPVLEQGARAPI